MRRLLLWILRDRILLALLILYAILWLASPGLMRGSYKYPDYGVLSLVAALMAGSLFLDASGLLAEAARRIVMRSGRFPFQMFLLAVAIMSIPVLNDAVVFVSVPLALSLADMVGIERGVAAAYTVSAVNIGSSMSPIGNPQNIIITHYYGLSHATYLSVAVKLYLVPLLLLAGMSPRPRGGIGQRIPPPVRVRRKHAILGLTNVATALILDAMGHPVLVLPLTLATLLLDLQVAAGYDLRVLLVLWLAYADLRSLSLLLHLSPLNSVEAYLAAYGLSQIVSNVPATIILLGSSWIPLSLGVNLGGLPFPQSSIANLIALRLSGLNPRRYVRVLAPLSIILFAYGILVSIIVGGGLPHWLPGDG